MREISNHADIAENVSLPENVAIGSFCVIKENASIGEGAILGVGCVIESGAMIGAGCRLGHYVTVGKGASLGADTHIGDHSTIYPGTALGSNCYIGSHATIGRVPRPAATSTVKVQADLPSLKLGAGSTVGCSAVLYAGTEFGEKVFVGDGALVRERCVIGKHVVIGSGAAVENETRIGAYTKIQTGSYITAYMEIEERVFIAPMVTTTNDNFMGRTEKRFKLVKGPTIQRGARIGGGSILLPGVNIAPETFVAAGALVTKDTQEGRVLKGFPAKDLRAVPEEELLQE